MSTVYITPRYQDIINRFKTAKHFISQEINPFEHLSPAWRTYHWISDCELFVAICPGFSLTELGMAIALGKMIIVASDGPLPAEPLLEHPWIHKMTVKELHTFIENYRGGKEIYLPVEKSSEDIDLEQAIF